MKLIFTKLCILMLFSIMNDVFAQSTVDSLKSEIAQWIEKNRAHRDLAQDCKPLRNFKKWENFELMDCSYQHQNTGGAKETRKGRVYMIQPDTDRIASWIINSCQDARGTATQTCIRATACRVKLQSGAQFPVAGIVTEDMDGDGFRESYAFRDGVTVVIDGNPHATKTQLNAQQIGLALERDLGPKLLSTASKAGPARIQGTSRVNYLKSGGKEDVTGLNWLNVVRSTFQKALQFDRNELMTAWVKQSSDKALEKLLTDARTGRLCTF
jgi:hypothetical protein